MVSGDHRDAQTLRPGALGQASHIALAALVAMLAILRLEEKALEVAEVIEDQAGNLAGV